MPNIDSQILSDRIRAENAVIKADEAIEAKDLAELARDGAITAKEESESARDTSVSAKDDSVTARDAAEQAETNAATSETNAATSESNAETSATNASTSETNAGLSEDKAEKWAEETEDVEVETGKFSALHHATKAEGSATQAATEVSNHEQTIDNHDDVTLTSPADGQFLQRESGVWVNKRHSSDFAKYRSDNMLNTVVWSETSGSGAVDEPTGPENYIIQTGTTAGSTAIARFGYRTGHFLNGNPQDKNFDNYWEAHVALSSAARTTNGVLAFYIGKAFDEGVGDPTDKAIGFALKNTDLYVQAHDGTSLTEQDTGSNITDDNTRLIQLFFTPATSLEIWLNGSKIDEIITGLPAGLKSNGIGAFFEVANNADAAGVTSRVLHCKLVNEF